MPSLYLGNLPYQITETEIREHFAPHKIRSVRIVIDKETNRPKGFGFIELESDVDIEALITAFDGGELGGRTLHVNEARNKSPKGPPPRTRQPH